MVNCETVAAECPDKLALVASRDAVRRAIRDAREAGDLDLVRALRQLDVAAEALLRARGELPARHAEHYWTTLRQVVKRRPDLRDTLLERRPH